jgi:hypothetical protein
MNEINWLSWLYIYLFFYYKFHYFYYFLLIFAIFFIKNEKKLRVVEFDFLKNLLKYKFPMLYVNHFKIFKTLL